MSALIRALAVVAGVFVAACGSDAAAPAPADPEGLAISFVDIGPGGPGGLGSLVVEADGTAMTLVAGELVTYNLPLQLLAELRDATAQDLEGLPAESTSNTSDQGVSSIAVWDEDGDVLSVRVEGERPPAFERARARLGDLVERIAVEGTVDRRAPISVTVYVDPNTEVDRKVRWPEGIPAPVLTERFDIQYPSFEGSEATTMREALGPPRHPTGVRLPDGTMAVASYTAFLPRTP